MKRVIKQSAAAQRPGSAPSSLRTPVIGMNGLPNGINGHTAVLATPANGRPLTSTGTRPGHLAVSNRIPDYVTKEKEVLRFQAYFQEPVHDGGSSDTSGFRVRTFALMFHLSDDTISIEEPRIVNSGLTQGKFMKRTRVERHRAVGGGCYQPIDLMVGQDLWVYGRRFRITDADERTREWYRSTLKVEQAPKESVPDDGYAQDRQRFQPPPPTTANGLPPREKGEFYKKDRKVLRFFCKYEDRRLLGDSRDYVLYYYLLNDTIEVKEIAAEGRHNFPNLLRRQKLPKDSMHVPTGYGGVISPRDNQRERVESVTWADLRCGEAISVYGRHLLPMSCDSSTAAWYAARGIHQPTLTIGHNEADERTGENVAPPPYNGFGNEDDLYAMGLSLEPMNKEVNQEEYERFLQGDKKVCRFNAKLANVENNDNSRDFVVNYFLADDTLSVFEPQVRNSGVVGGPFLARGRYKKYIPAVGQEAEGTRLSEKITMDGGLMEARVGLGGQLSRWLRPTDFVPGSIITFEMPQSGSKLFTLQLLGFDEYSRKLLADRSIFPHTAPQLSVAKLSETVSSAKLPARAILRRKDRSGSRTLSMPDFTSAVAALEKSAAAVAPSARAGHLCLTDSELTDVANDFLSPRKDGVVYDDFVDMLVVASPRSAKLKERSTGALRVHERILKFMCMAYEEEGGSAGRLRSVFRKRDAEGNGRVSQSVWVQVLKETKLNTVMTRQVAEALCLEHDTNGTGTLDYNALCDDIFKGDFSCLPGTMSEALGQSAVAEDAPETDSPFETSPSQGNLQPLTVGECMKRMNERIFTHGGDISLQLARAMRSFSSAFARANRKKMIRKHFLAFDVRNTGRVSKAQFLETMDEVAAEFFMDFELRDRNLLADFFFPRPGVRVDYEELLDIITARDVRRAKSLLERTLAEGCDYEEIFTTGDGMARARDFGGTLNLFAPHN